VVRLFSFEHCPPAAGARVVRGGENQPLSRGHNKENTRRADPEVMANSLCRAQAKCTMREREVRTGKWGRVMRFGGHDDATDCVS
jgi:hypothetical protein